MRPAVRQCAWPWPVQTARHSVRRASQVAGLVFGLCPRRWHSRARPPWLSLPWHRVAICSQALRPGGAEGTAGSGAGAAGGGDADATGVPAGTGAGGASAVGVWATGGVVDAVVGAKGAPGEVGAEEQATVRNRTGRRERFVMPLLTGSGGSDYSFC